MNSYLGQRGLLPTLTEGYGDITPLSPPAKAFSYVEAVTGQIYLAVLIARLVGLHIAHSMKKDPQ